MDRVMIGVLALQGAFREHIQMLEAMGVRAVQVKRPSDLEGCKGLIIPGGESTAIGKLMLRYGFVEPLRERILAGMPIFGTCAGMILLASAVAEGDQPLLDLMDIRVRRNAYGRQVDSFEAPLELAGIAGGPFTGVFIRAPWIEDVGNGVETLGRYDGRIVMARQGNILVAAFHPELTGDGRVHRYFLDMVGNGRTPEG
jgi:5'-phosphate synthase pdxT subunit